MNNSHYFKSTIASYYESACIKVVIKVGFLLILYSCSVPYVFYIKNDSAKPAEVILYPHIWRADTSTYKIHGGQFTGEINFSTFKELDEREVGFKLNGKPLKIEIAPGEVYSLGNSSNFRLGSFDSIKIFNGSLSQVMTDPYGDDIKQGKNGINRFFSIYQIK